MIMSWMLLVLHNKPLLVAAFFQMCACTDFSATHMEDLLSTCQREVSKNMTYYEYNSDTGRFEPPAILDLICPVNCMDRGECVDGEAICCMTSFLRCCKMKQSASVRR